MYVGTDRPTMKYLNKHVRPDIAAKKWYDIGIELLDEGDEKELNTIKANNPADHDTCAGEMLQLWLARKPDASWNQLLQAFREPHIGLHALASKIEGMLYKGMITYCNY